MTKFAVRLKELRMERNMTQVQLSQATGISQAIISLYEKGLRTPTIDIIVIFCNFFKISSDYLIGLVD